MPEQSKSPLNLNRQSIPKEPLTPQDAANTMGEFYTTLGNCLINMVAIHSDIANSIREISLDTSLLAELAGKESLHSGIITSDEFDEMFNQDEEPEPPANMDKKP